jgi:hypothetical protein
LGTDDISSDELEKELEELLLQETSSKIDNGNQESPSGNVESDEALIHLLEELSVSNTAEAKKQKSPEQRQMVAA